MSLASDGTALKPGLEYDPRQKQVIGLTHKVDEKFVKKHPLPDPEKIKTNLITSADVTIATSLDNGAAMPVAVFFRPKSVTGEEIFSSMKDSIRTVQTCENCLKVQRSVKHIVSSENFILFSNEQMRGVSIIKIGLCDLQVQWTSFSYPIVKGMWRLFRLERDVPLPDVVLVGKSCKCSWSN